MSPLHAVYLLPLALAVYYAVRCAWWPLKRCRRCKGEGTRRRRFGRLVRLCRSCKGTGDTVRWGRVIVDRIRTTRAAERKAST